MKIKTISVSGFGGEYENTCQKMLWNAVRYIAINKPVEVTSEQSEHIYGIAINKGEHGTAFDKAMMEGIEDATGVMHQAVTNHAFYIANNGYNRWLEMGIQHRQPEDIFEFEYPNDFDLESMVGEK